MTVPLVGEYGGIVPNPNTQSAEDFSVNAIDWTSYQANTLGQDINASISQFNIDFQIVNQNSQDAQEAAEAANLSELSAASSANFKGRWSDATGAATVPSSYENNGRVWQLLQNIPDITADEPMEGAANWLLIDSVNMSNVRVSKVDNPSTHLFKKNKLVDTLSGTLSVTRNSTATYIDRHGFVRTAGVDEPREEEEGWLIEGTSTNKALQSEDFSTTWLMTRASITPNDDIAPDLLSTADLLTATSNAAYVRQTVTGTIGTPITISCFVKYTNHTIGYIRAGGNTNTFNVQDGSPISIANGYTYSSKSMYNGWFRVSITYTPTVTGDIGLQIGITSNTADDSVLIWGAQVEDLPFATSYIPTTNAPVTRLADSYTANSYNNFVESDYTIFAKFKNAGYPSPDSTLLDISDGTLANRTFITMTSSGRLRYSQASDGSSQFNIIGGDLSVDTLNAVSITFDGSVATSYLDGSVISTATGSPTLQTIEIEIGVNVASVDALYGHIQDLRIYDFALNSDEVRYLG